MQTDTADISSGTYYHFYPGREKLIEDVQPFEIKNKLNRTTLIEQLGDHLAETYFAKIDSVHKTNIQFELLGIQPVYTPHRSYLIAIINMVDEKEYGVKHFFQGSFGGQVTFALITATFLQPQNNPPLIDGLILNYNGKKFPVLSHISFEGIITPKSVKKIVLSAINDSHFKSPAEKKDTFLP